MDSLATIFGFDQFLLETIFYLFFGFIHAFLELLGVVGVVECWNGCVAFLDAHLQVI